MDLLDFKDHFPFPLYQYQLDAIRKMHQTLVYETYPMRNNQLEFLRAFLLYDEMGLGKSVQAWATLLQLPRHEKTIIVCPSSCIHVWAKDKPGTFTLYYTYDPEKEYLADDVIILSYSKVCRSKGIVYQCGLLILDEVQKIKNASSRTAKTVNGIKRTYSLCLSGTPIMNGGYEFKSILTNGMHLLNLDYGLITKYPGGNYYLNLLSKISLGRTAAALDELRTAIPDRQYSFIEQVFVPMDNYTKLEYVRVKRQLMGTFKSMTSTSVLAAIQRLRQLCLSRDYKKTAQPSIYYSIWYLLRLGKMPLAVVMLIVHYIRQPVVSYKMQEAVKIIRDTEGKSLVFCTFKSFLRDTFLPFLRNNEINALLLCGGSRSKQQQVIQQFKQDYKVKVLLVVKSVGALGLNFQDTADTCIIMDPHYNQALDEQACNRIFRLSTSNTLKDRKRVRKLFVKDSIEEVILLMQQQKNSDIESWLRLDSAKDKPRMLDQYHRLLMENDKIKI